MLNKQLFPEAWQATPTDEELQFDTLIDDFVVASGHESKIKRGFRIVDVKGGAFTGEATFNDGEWVEISFTEQFGVLDSNDKKRRVRTFTRDAYGPILVHTVLKTFRTRTSGDIPLLLEDESAAIVEEDCVLTEAHNAYLNDLLTTARVKRVSKDLSEENRQDASTRQQGVGYFLKRLFRGVVFKTPTT